MSEKVGVYICHCGTNIAGTVDVEAVARWVGDQDNVEVARDYKFMCSSPGQELIEADIKEKGLTRVVVASCSPHMHEKTFRTACARGGLNPFLFEMANIREHDSWTTDDKEAATLKAKALAKAAVSRVIHHQPLEPLPVEINPNTLIVGGGIAGISTALELAEAGYHVYLVEREPSIGGHMAQLDKTFPTLDCSACILTPKMVEVGQHDNITLLSYSEVEEVEGYLGNFTVTVRKKARYVDEELCTSCDDCTAVCPVNVFSEFDLGLTTRKAIYRPFPQAVPNSFVIDKRPSPCKVTCPAHLPVQGYIALIAQGKFKESLALVREHTPFVGTLGRVCDHLCELECKRVLVDQSVAVCGLKRFVADVADDDTLPQPIEATWKEKVAIIGAGPAGLSASYDLVRMGYRVTVFEALSMAGGMLSWGIPAYRLPREVLQREVDYINALGVEIKLNTPIGVDGGPNLADLRQEYDAVFIAVGAHKSRALEVPGEDLPGVIHSTDFLRELNMDKPVKLGKRVVVIGGGNAAVDAARSALRLGSEVTIVYRRSRVEMPALTHEVDAAEEEGIQFHFLATPARILEKDGRVGGIECIRMELGAPDESGRRRPIPISGSEFTMDVDTVIVSIGQKPDLMPLEDVERTRWDTVVADVDTMTTPMEGVFAGGDAVSGPASAILAIAAGRQAAQSVHRYLRDKDLREERTFQWPQAADIQVMIPVDIEPAPRREMSRLPVAERHTTFKEVELGFTQEQAVAEAERCLACAVCSECLECVRVCSPGAIDLSRQDEVLKIDVGNIILATGYDLFDVQRIPQYGYERLANVFTGLEFERMVNAAGPTGGQVVMRDKETPPESVAIIHCVGSRDENYHKYCSKVCCMYSLKFAHLVHERLPEAEVYSCYIDMRTPGKGYEEFYHRLLEEGTHFIRGKVAEVMDFARTPGEEGKLIVQVEDTLIGKQRRIPVDMVILSPAIEARHDSGKIAQLFKMGCDFDGFFIERHPKLDPVATMTEGIYISGACQGPKDIPDSVAQGAAAAARVAGLISRGTVMMEPVRASITAEQCSGCRICNNLCPYNAIEFREEEKVSEVITALCQGCGTCVAACPSAAITGAHFTNDQVMSEIEGILWDTIELVPA